MTLILGSDYRHHGNHILCIAHRADCRSPAVRRYLIPTYLALNTVSLSEAWRAAHAVVFLMLCSRLCSWRGSRRRPLKAFRGGI